MPRLLLTRPAGQNEEWQALLAASGIESMTSPLLRIVPLAFDGTTLEAQKVSGVIITSRHALIDDSCIKTLDVYAVGEQLAAEARKHGYRSIRHIAPSAEELAYFLKGRTFTAPLLYLSGRVTQVDLAALLAEEGIKVVTHPVYDAVAEGNLTLETQTAIAEGLIDGVLLFSTRSAVVFHHLVKKAGLGEALRRVTAFCLSDNIAAECAAKNRWNAVFASVRPDRESLLSLITSHYNN